MPTIESFVGNTPLVRLQRLNPNSSNQILVKLEGNNPAGSVKDRPALNMILEAERRGDIRQGDTLIEATSGNTGIALAMVAAIRGLNMVLIMPDNMTEERRASMRAYGAQLISVSADEGMEGVNEIVGVRDIVGEVVMLGVIEGKGMVLDQFANPDNPAAHYKTTGPEIWRDTQGEVTHFVSSMGTTGTIMGTSRFLREQSESIEIVGVQPESDQDKIPGIRRWPEAYLPKIYDARQVDRILDMSQQEAEQTTLRLATEEGILAGISSGGAVAAAIRISMEVEGATIVAIICDRGDRYLSSGVFPAE